MEELTDKKAKREEERWYPLGLDPDTKKVVFTDRKGNTKLGDLPPGVKSIAPKTEKIPTERSKFTEDLYGKLRLKTMNIERKQKGLPPLLELPDNESGTKPVKTTQWPEGTIIKKSDVKKVIRKIMRNGEFVDYTGGES